MKSYKRIIALVLSVLVFSMSAAFASLAAEAVEPTATLDESTAQVYMYSVQQIIEQFASKDDESLKSLSEIAGSSGADFYVDAIKDFIDVRKTSGEYVEFVPIEVVIVGENLHVHGTIKFEKRDCDLVFVMTPENETWMEFTPDPTFGEKMKNAGLNLILGMGTVFIVLIFLALVISLFKYIPMFEKKLEEWKSGKKAGGVVTEPAAVTTVAQAVAPAAADTDGELIAVIAAAIAASEGTSTDGLIVRSIKRVNKRR